MSEVETGVEEIPLVGDEGEPVLETETVQSLSSSTIPPDVREKWGEASQLLFQPGYIHVLKQMALSGQLQKFNIRSVAWRLFLGCLPTEQSMWKEATFKSRQGYSQLKKKHITDPHITNASLDVTINNPLSLAEDSPWHQFFQDNELRQVINQDVVRTFPDVAFFKQDHIQETMLDLLFIYCKENPELGYRQGMHEVLAPIIFVLHAEERDHNDTSLAPEVQIVMDADYLEHDAYTIFSELMENMESWYMSSALEVDYYRIRTQANSNRKMQHDPRTQKPFEENEALHTSAISRKLEKIHHVLLKRADEVLYAHLKELSIPAQTYGIRWIRLLFGREFPLPSVLELWDALFADGPSLGLMDYICVAMLMHIRDVLIEGNYARCMLLLMKFPVVYEVNYLVQRALHLRNPTLFPSPRIWSYHPTRIDKVQLFNTGTQLLDESYSTGTGSSGLLKSKTQINAEKITDYIQSKTKFIPKSMTSHPNRNTARLEFQKSSSRSPSPNHKQLEECDDARKGDEQLFSGVGSTGGGGTSKRAIRFRILGDRNKGTKVDSSGREMMNNPKTHPVEEASLSELERLTSRIEDLEAKCLYCGGKMETVVHTLQEEIPNLPNLSQEKEDSLFLAIAGLKQIRDLLLKKIPFSGDATLGWDSSGNWKERYRSDSSVSSTNKEHSGNVDPDSKIEETSTRTDSILIPETDTEVVSDSITLPGTNTEGDSDSRDVSNQDVGESVEEDSLSSVGDDWVTLSTSLHPLVTSTD